MKNLVMNGWIFDLKPGVRYRFGMRTKLSGGGKDVSFTIFACPQKQRDMAFKPAMTASTAGSDKSTQTSELFSCNLRKDGGHDWTERETGRDDGCADILMPAACEMLLVWVRLHGAGEGKAEACFDGVFLEQLPSDDTRQ